jgi:N-acyl-D-amino-acid deacylase
VWVERAASWRRFGDWLAAMEANGVSPNVGSFLGGGTLRTVGKGMDMGPADAEERALMRRTLAEAMEDGAFGVSYALIYPPDAYAVTEELVDVCRAMAPYGGVYITHLRSESDGILGALEEALTIGREAGVPVEVYHLKAAHPRAWHLMPAVIERIHRARADGLDVTADMYPYAASGTGLSAILPTWTAEGGRLYERLRDPEVRRRVRDFLEGRVEDDGMGLETLGGAHGIMPVGFLRPEHQAYVGKRLDEIADMRGQDWIDATLDLLVAEGQRISTFFFSMDEANLRLQLRQPWIKFSTDAGGHDPAWAKAFGPVHPRGYGTYPRVLRKYVREERLLSLEEAVRKMTSSVADRLSLRDRGQLREGFYADVVVFDPETVGDRATFEDPHQLSVGVRDVWVNGGRVLAGGEHTGATPGRFVKGRRRGRRGQAPSNAARTSAIRAGSLSSSAATPASTAAPSSTVASPRGEPAATSKAAVCGIAASSIASRPCRLGSACDTLPMSDEPVAASGSTGRVVRPRRAAWRSKAASSGRLKRISR